MALVYRNFLEKSRQTGNLPQKGEILIEVLIVSESRWIMRKHFSGSAFARECPYSSGIHRRAAVFFVFCAVAFTLLYLRVEYLSRSPGLAQTARQQSKYTLAVSKTRGGIYDCRLRPLVNEEQEKVWAVLPSAENLTAVRKAVPASRRGEVSEQLKNGKPFLLRGVSDIEAPGADAFFVPVGAGTGSWPLISSAIPTAAAVPLRRPIMFPFFEGGLCGIGSVISIWC